jgi:hypothetical protein
MVRVGRQDQGSPTWPQRTLLRVRGPFPVFGKPATHRRFQVRKMRPLVVNVGREGAKTGENLVFGRVVSLDGVRELARP